MNYKLLLIGFLSCLILSCGKDSSIEGNSQQEIQSVVYKTNPQSQSQSSVGYLVYTAILNQSGANAPVATVLENTIGNIIWTRVGNGAYRANLTGAFTFGKTWWEVGQNVDFAHARTSFLFIDENSIELVTQRQIIYFGDNEFTEETIDGVLVNTPVELRVYP